MNIRLSCTVPLILAVAVANIAHAKELHVNGATGDDAVTYADNGASRPWRTLGRAIWGSTNRSSTNAAQAAAGGDIVIVAAGTYDTNASTGRRYEPIYNPANSGTSTNPIVIKAEQPGAVQLRSSLSSTGQPIIGTLDRSHVVWDGFVVDEQFVPTAQDTGPVVVWGSTNVTLQNLTIRGYNRGWVDNHNGIRLEAVDNITIRNNVISGYREPQQGINASAITMYDTGSVLVENNEISNVNSGVHVKAYIRGPITVRYNLIRSASVGISIGVVGEDRQRNPVNGSYQFYSNVIVDTWAGVELRGYDEITPTNVTIANNTILNSSGGDGGALLFRPGYRGYRNIRTFNNILARAQAGFTAWTANVESLAQIQSSHNLFFQNSTPVSLEWQAYSLSAWRSTYGKDVQGSLEADPRFRNEASGDLRLDDSSPARGSGIDILDLNRNGSTLDAINIGAYAIGNEVIGLNRSIGPVPAPPTQLLVQ